MNCILNKKYFTINKILIWYLLNFFIIYSVYNKYIFTKIKVKMYKKYLSCIIC